MFLASEFASHPIQRVHVLFHGTTCYEHSGQSTVPSLVHRRSVSCIFSCSSCVSCFALGGLFSSFTSGIWSNLSGKYDYSSHGASGNLRSFYSTLNPSHPSIRCNLFYRHLASVRSAENDVPAVRHHPRTCLAGCDWSIFLRPIF